MKVCVFSNPNGRRVKRHLYALIQKLSSLDGLGHEIEHLVTDRDAKLEQIIAARTWGAQDLVVINGGDGTAQHVFTVFLNLGLETLPIFTLLPGGTTNMTARAYNTSRSYPSALMSLQGLIDKGESELLLDERQLVGVETLDATDGLAKKSLAQKTYGAFFGTGLIVQGIQFCHDFVYKTGMRSELGAGMALIRAVWGIAFKQAPFEKAVTVGLGDKPAEPMLVLMFSSLPKLFLGMRPFWGTEPGALHMTGIRQGAERFLRRLPTIIRGGDLAAKLSAAGKLNQEAGYESGNLDSIKLYFDGPYTIDGELFETRGSVLNIAASATIRVLSL